MNCAEDDFEPSGKMGSTSGAFVSPIREGTVTYPKTELFSARSGIRGLASAGRGSRMRIIPADVEARLTYLEVQVQELRAENKLLGRELTSLSDEVTRVHESKVPLGASLQSSETIQTAGQRRRRSSFRTSLDNDRMSPAPDDLSEAPDARCNSARSSLNNGERMSPLARPIDCEAQFCMSDDGKYHAMKNEISELHTLVSQLQKMLMDQSKQPADVSAYHERHTSQNMSAHTPRIDETIIHSTQDRIVDHEHSTVVRASPKSDGMEDTPQTKNALAPKRKETKTAPSLVTIDPAPGISTSPGPSPPRPAPIITSQSSSMSDNPSRNANADLSTAMESFLDVISKCTEATHQVLNYT